MMGRGVLFITFILNFLSMATENTNSTTNMAMVVLLTLVVLLVAFFLFRWYGTGAAGSRINVTLPSSIGNTAAPQTGGQTGGQAQ